jgi:hypothetical protein
MGQITGDGASDHPPALRLASRSPGLPPDAAGSSIIEIPVLRYRRRRDDVKFAAADHGRDVPVHGAHRRSTCPAEVMMTTGSCPTMQSERLTPGLHADWVP